MDSYLSSQAAKRYWLRYATIYLFPPSLLLLLGEAFLNSRTDEIPFLAGLPLAASAILGIHVIRRRESAENASLTSRTIHPMDKATLMALDIMLGSVLLLMAFASWFVVQMEKETYRTLGQTATLPLMMGFCIHYFLAFAAMEEGFLTGQCSECTHCHDLNRFATVAALYNYKQDVLLPLSRADLACLEKDAVLLEVTDATVDEKAAPES